jgi:hypothetical protein
MEQLEKIAMYLQDAEKHRLQAEVVYLALKYMKENPDKSLDDAMAYGYYKCCK